MLTIDFIGFGSLTRKPDSDELILNRIVNSFGEKNDMQKKLDATVILYLFIYNILGKIIFDTFIIFLLRIRTGKSV
jgi:hypothetical protein